VSSGSGRRSAHLYELISERTGRSLILTSNRSPADWYPLFPNPVVAESLLDRLINTSHQVLMTGPSYRPPQTARPHPPGHEERHRIVEIHQMTSDPMALERPSRRPVTGTVQRTGLVGRPSGRTAAEQCRSRMGFVLRAPLTEVRECRRQRRKCARPHCRTRPSMDQGVASDGAAAGHIWAVHELWDPRSGGGPKSSPATSSRRIPSRSRSLLPRPRRPPQGILNNPGSRGSPYVGVPLEVLDLASGKATYAGSLRLTLS